MKFSEYSKAEHRALSRKGGINSVKSRQARREAIEQEIIHDAALNEMRCENIRTIAAATRILMEANRVYEHGGLDID